MTTPTLFVLNALVNSPASRAYGLELLRATGLKSGTLYPILRRLEAAGWLQSEWETPSPGDLGRPRRRHYWLTGEGVDRAGVELERVRRTLSPKLRPAFFGGTS